jgi:hypothetical protein
MIVYLLAAVLAAEELTPRHPLLEFTLDESDQQLLARFDRPPQVARGKGFFVLQFHAMAPIVIEDKLPVEWLANANQAACDGKYSYTAYFTADGILQSVLHQPDRRLPIQYLFPSGTYRDYEVKNAVGLAFRYRVRKLKGGRLLVATLYQAEVKYIDQAILLRASHLGSSFPMLAALYSE